jgi:hypothetical protein
MGPTMRGRGSTGRRSTGPVLNSVKTAVTSTEERPRGVLCPRSRTNPNESEGDRMAVGTEVGIRASLCSLFELSLDTEVTGKTAL